MLRIFPLILSAAMLLAACDRQNKAIFVDFRDNKVYEYVTIGEQVWMAENLNYEADGSICYENKPENCEKYGRLYNWDAAMQACPDGWHLPSKDEWDELLGYTGAGSKSLKAKNGWGEEGGGEDKFGFAALPGGYGHRNGNFENIGKHGNWWSRESNRTHAYNQTMYYGDDSVSYRYNFKKRKQSVRCMQGSAKPAKAAAPNNFSGKIKAVYESIGYRGLSREEIPAGALTGLFNGDSVYYMKPEKNMFDPGYDKCSGDSTLRIVSKAEFIFVDFEGYNKNEIKHVPIYSKKEIAKEMPPGEKISFEFEGRQYELEALGEGEYDLKNYALVFSIKGNANKQTILNIRNTDDATPQLLFIGDLDGDGKPDIILDARYNYENRIIKVFLSSTANEGEYLKFEAERFDWFDC